jgi:hypothetical protein
MLITLDVLAASGDVLPGEATLTALRLGGRFGRSKPTGETGFDPSLTARPITLSNARPGSMYKARSKLHNPEIFVP